MKDPQRQLDRFVSIGRAEGVSFILLVFIAMPLKYGLDMPLMVKYVGWAHGLLFMIYMAQLAWVAYLHRWDILKVIYGMIAALLPFGPFVYERTLRSAN